MLYPLSYEGGRSEIVARAPERAASASAGPGTPP